MRWMLARITALSILSAKEIHNAFRRPTSSKTYLKRAVSRRYILQHFVQKYFVTELRMHILDILQGNKGDLQTYKEKEMTRAIIRINKYVNK